MAISCSYYLEPLDTTDLPRRFLEAFPCPEVRNAGTLRDVTV